MPRAAIIIASANRPSILSSQLNYLRHHFGDEAQIIVSIPDLSSLGSGDRAQLTVVTGNQGLTVQRNAAIKAITSDCEFVFFFDDDALPHKNYLRAAINYFETNPQVVGITGRLLADGVVSGEIKVSTALELLEREMAFPGYGASVRGLYGCNFAVKRPFLQLISFDERLPLYSWLEDLDFSRQLARHGLLHKIADAVCVHLGSASGGRTSHIRFGYSQITNPIYLWRKGSIGLGTLSTLISRPLISNMYRLVIRREVKWRFRRLQGNLLSAFDLLRGRITPERIKDLI